MPNRLRGRFDGEVWLVASDPVLRQSMTALVGSWGVQVRSFASEKSCIRVMMCEDCLTPSCLIIDTFRLEMSSGEISAAMSALAPSLPIVFTEGHAARPAHSDSELLRCIEKPYQPDTLSDAIAELTFRAGEPSEWVPNVHASQSALVRQTFGSAPPSK